MTLPVSHKSRRLAFAARCGSRRHPQLLLFGSASTSVPSAAAAPAPRAVAPAAVDPFAEVTREALELLELHELPAAGWSFGFNRRKRAYGLCRFGPKRIELSRYFACEGWTAAVRDTVLHEIAHALAGSRAGHGPAWRAVCVRIGAKPERCGTEPMTGRPPARYAATCTCGATHERHRRTPAGSSYRCRRCRDRLTYTDRRA